MEFLQKGAKVQIQQPNIASFAKADYKLLQNMSDNDDAIRDGLEMNSKGVIALGVANNMKTTDANYSYTLGVGYTQHNTINWIPMTFSEPAGSNLTVNFESNRYYKIMLHLDYVWASNLSDSNAATGRTGRIEIRVRDITHRHDLLYWTNLVDADYQMGGTIAAFGNWYLHRDIENNSDVNIWSWGDASAKGSIPSSCHAVRCMAAKTSGAAILQVQFRPMVAFGGIVPPSNMDLRSDVSPYLAPPFGLPQQYSNGIGAPVGSPRDLEAIKQFNGYISVEDCGPCEKPAGVEPGVLDDNSISPMFEVYENNPYDVSALERP